MAGQQITLEANPNYWQGAPSIKRLIFKVVPESSNRVAMLTKGEIDIATELTPKEIDSLKTANGVRTVNIPANTNEFLVMNEQLVPAFADARVRQAVNYVIPKDEIVKTAYFGQAKQWNSVFTSVVPGSMPASQWMYSYNVDKAKELMREAGFEKGLDVELYYSAGWPAHETAAIQLQESLAKIGIRVALRKTPTGSFDTLVRSYQAPFAILHEYPALPNGIFHMSLYYLSKKAGGAYGAFGHFENGEVDQLLVDGIRTPFADQQEKSLKIQQLIMEQAPVGWIAESNYTAAIRDNIKGFNWDFAQGTRFYQVSKQ
jgi:peptide/nickel transport system substrate-binding protein